MGVLIYLCGDNSTFLTAKERDNLDWFYSRTTSEKDPLPMSMGKICAKESRYSKN